MKPAQRVQLARWHFYGSIVVGIIVCVGMATKVISPLVSAVILMAVSFYAITITAADVWATTDVRREVENSDDKAD